MKIFVLKHPARGYITNKRGQPNFSNDIEKALKYTRRSDATQTVNYGSWPERSECEVITILILDYEYA